MKIYGLQKMTLLDFPGRVACTVFLGGCDYRCPFCHNFELVDGTANPVMEEEELLGFLSKRTGLLDGVAFTGGEPCLHRDLPELMRKIRAMGYKIKLDTNGYHPALLREMLTEGLVDYVAMDVKNSPRKYAETCGVQKIDMDIIRESIEIIKTLAPDYEFRTTVVNELHDNEDFEEIGKLIEGAKRYFLQRFTDRDSVPFEGLSAPTKERMLQYADTARKYVGNTEIRGVD